MNSEPTTRGILKGRTTMRRQTRGGLLAGLALSLASASTMVTVGAAASRAQADHPGAAPIHAPAAAPGNVARDGRIVYVNGDTGQLNSSNPDGTAVVQVTHLPNGAVAAQPRWLPPHDTRIVFVSNVHGDFALYAINADGTGRHRIFTDRPGFNAFTPTPTPDGRRVVFGRCRPDPPGGCALYSVRIDGSGLHALTSYAADVADVWPSVAPDGDRVAFSRFGWHGIAAQTWVMRLDGGHAHPITPPWLEGAVPRWLPDGNHLLVTSQWVRRVVNAIYRLRVDGSDRVALTTPRFPHSDEAATPSPSGRRIVFVSDRAYPDITGLDLFVMRADGSGQHRIRAGLFFDSDWGSAPLLPADAGSPRREPSPPLSPRQRRAAMAAMSRWLPAHP
jgi:Tol biopolymer transport system component